jgi:Mor family transcriptional regulator
MAMIDPERHDLPDSVLDLLGVIQEAMTEVGCPDPVTGAGQITGMILRNWGGIDAYVAPPGARVNPRFIEEIAIWSQTAMRALGMDDVAASSGAEHVAATVRQTYGGLSFRLPKDRWSFRAEMSARFNGHNQVDLCREFGLGTSTFYRMIFEERNSRRRKAPTG